MTVPQAETIVRPFSSHRLAKTDHSSYPDPLGNIQTAVEKLPNGHTKETLLVLIDKTKRETALVSKEIAAAGQRVERFRENVENWFNQAMDRVSGWYKRWT